MFINYKHKTYATFKASARALDLSCASGGKTTYRSVGLYRKTAHSLSKVV